MPLHRVTGNNLDIQEKYNLKAYYSDKFDVEQTSNLSLFLYTHALAILAKNANGSVIGCHLYTFDEKGEIPEIVERDLFINADNTAGKLFVYNNHFCLVPSVLFDPSVKSTFLKFSSRVDEEKQEVFYEGVDSNNLQVVGAIDKEVLLVFDRGLPDLDITHASSLILSYLLSDKNNMLGQELYVFAEDGHVFLAGFGGSELKIFNRFPVRGEQDFLKYTFAVLHQLGFDRMHCRITCLGNLEGIGVDPGSLNIYFKYLLHEVPKLNQTYSPGAEGFKESKLLEAYWTV